MPGDETDYDAYIGVRVPDGPHPDGSILVYLANGTGLVVNSNQLLHLDTGRTSALGTPWDSHRGGPRPTRNSFAIHTYPRHAWRKR
jgi:hypothetical protein